MSSTSGRSRTSGGAETRLILEAKEGSAEALNAVFERYGERLLALIRLRLGPARRNDVDTQDVMQQTMFKAFSSIDQFDGSGAKSLMGWLGAIARNEILDQLRYQHREARDVRRNVPLEDAQWKVAEQLRTEVSRIHLRDQSLRLERALEALADDHREVIVLRRFEELGFAEIGERLGRSADACRMLHARAMSALTLEMKKSAEP